MDTKSKITVGGVLTEGTNIGLKNAASLLGVVVLWLLTIWIPYINVGTTIAMISIPIELSKGKVISPTFIFDGKYRKYMGEFFTLIGMMWLAILPAMFFMFMPGIIIAIGWSLALYILLDKGVAPGEAMIRSNKATYGYKWTIFFIGLVLAIAYFILLFVVNLISFNIGFISAILTFAVIVVYMVISLGCNAVIYRNLTEEEKPETKEEVAPAAAE